MKVRIIIIFGNINYNGAWNQLNNNNFNPINNFQDNFSNFNIKFLKNI